MGLARYGKEDGHLCDELEESTMGGGKGEEGRAAAAVAVAAAAAGERWSKVERFSSCESGASVVTRGSM